MNQTGTEQYRKIVAAVVAAAARLPKSQRGADHKRFLEAYYSNVDVEDIAARDPAALAGAALSHLKFAHRRRGRALVRVFNPTLRECGYSSPHTVIEMVNDDMPFLVDSIGLALAHRSLTMHFLAHPIFAVARDGAGVLRSIEQRAASAERRQRLESFQHVEIDRVVDPTVLLSLCADIERSMRDVRVAFADWAKMRAAARQTSDDLSSLSSRFDARDVSEAQALLSWMEDRHFTFLGFKEYRLRTRKGQDALEPVESTGLGLLRTGHKRPPSSSRTLASDIRRQSRARDLVLVTKANLQSSVHRAGYLDYVGIKYFDPAGNLVGLQFQSAGNPAGPAQGRPGRTALCARARQSRRQGTAAHPGSVSARRAVPGERAGSDSPGHRHLRAPGTAAGAPAAASRPVSALLLLPHIRAPREVQHPGARAHRTRDRRRVDLDQHGIPGTDRRIQSRPHPPRRAHAAERIGAHRWR
jgi:NAD-specific glutamate dehydrogenase